MNTAHGFPDRGPVTLRVNLAGSPLRRAIEAGEIGSDLVRWDFCGPANVAQGFAPMVRDEAFDLGELAIATAIQASHYRKPIALLPIVTAARHHHRSIVCDPRRGLLVPSALSGTRVAVRSYAVTTALWVRAILLEEHGVAADSIQWIVNTGSHLAEYSDPANVTRVTGGSPEALALDGGATAAIVGGKAPAPLDCLLADPDRAAEAWHHRRGFVPVNHMLAMRTSLAHARPDVVREIWRIAVESHAALSSEERRICPIGVEANRAALESALRHAAEQKLVPEVLSLQDLFEDTSADLRP